MFEDYQDALSTRKNQNLIFPTGGFVGVYYSEELKYARDLGYTVLPISGYLFEKMESPFSHFVSSPFVSRLEAKKSGNEALSYVCKILMNSLYGRFGINPKSTRTEVCHKDRYHKLMKNSEYSVICLTRTTTLFPTIAIPIRGQIIGTHRKTLQSNLQLRSQPLLGSICTLISQERTATTRTQTLLCLVSDYLKIRLILLS